MAQINLRNPRAVALVERLAVRTGKSTSVSALLGRSARLVSAASVVEVRAVLASRARGTRT